MAKIKIENKFVIDGKPVEYVTEFGGLKVYVNGPGDNDKIFFFSKNDIVVKSLEISADCAQNMGYIDKCDFFNVGK